MAATHMLNLQPNDLVLLTDADEIPTATGVMQASNFLWNGIKPENGTVPMIQFGYASYVFSLYHLAVRGFMQRWTCLRCHLVGHPRSMLVERHPTCRIKQRCTNSPTVLRRVSARAASAWCHSARPCFARSNSLERTALKPRYLALSSCQ